MTAGTREEIMVEEIVIRFLLEGEQSDGTVAMFEFDVPAGSTGDLDATALAIVTPGILGPDYFRDVAAVLDATAGGPPDLAAIAAVMRRHGITPAS